MKPIKVLGAILAIVLIVGCASQSRTMFNTLASVQTVTTGAYNTYLDAVVQGKVATNSVPIVSKDYNTFQEIWTAAATVAQWNTNSLAPSIVTDASARVILDINTAKGVK